MCTPPPSEDLLQLDPSRAVLSVRRDVDQGIALLEYLYRGASTSPGAMTGTPGVLEMPMFAEASVHAAAALTALLSFTLTRLHACTPLSGVAVSLIFLPVA